MKKFQFIMLTILFSQLFITEVAIKENEGFDKEYILACKDCRD